jgi:SAM-dependent methyltransferase
VITVGAAADLTATIHVPDNANRIRTRQGGAMHLSDDGAPAAEHHRPVAGETSVRAGHTDFDAFYSTTPPWDIGRPQPALLDLARTGAIVGRVLDAGCGTGEHALMAAELGLEATGVDIAATAIAHAQDKARERGLTARFVVGDARDLGTLGEHFDTVLDSGLLHVFEDEDRARYVDALAAVVPSGGRVHLLCFSEHVPGDTGPRRVTQDEIRSSFRHGWRVDAIQAARILATFNADGVPAWRATIYRT